MGFIIGLLRPIAQWILAEFLAKIALHLKEAWDKYQHNKEVKKAQEAAIKKHEENIKNGATDEELAQSFEDVLNSRRPK